MASHRAVMTLALLAAAGVDVDGAMRAARQTEAPPPPEPGKPESVVDWYRRREREARERKRGRRG